MAVDESKRPPSASHEGDSAPGDQPTNAAPGKTLSPAARRALEEAAARRAAQEAAEAGAPEQGGPSGPEPTRYGDWERKGRATDF